MMYAIMQLNTDSFEELEDGKYYELISLNTDGGYGYIKDNYDNMVKVPTQYFAVIDIEMDIVAHFDKADIVTVWNSETDEDNYEQVEVLWHTETVLDGIYFGGECVIDISNINDLVHISNNGYQLNNLHIHLYGECC